MASPISPSSLSPRTPHSSRNFPHASLASVVTENDPRRTRSSLAPAKSNSRLSTKSGLQHFSTVHLQPPVPSLPTERVSKKIVVDMRVRNASARLANPLAGISRAELYNDGRRFAQERDMWDDEALIGRGALVAQDPTGFEHISELLEPEKEALRAEQANRWDHPRQLFWLVMTCSVAAAVQGMDQATINGATLFWPGYLHVPENVQDVRHSWVLGLVNSAPYLCSAVLGVWLTSPLNKWFGRRGTIFIAAFLSLASCVWQVFAGSWQMLFVARFLLGLGIAPKSTTVPIYSAECAPAAIRGAMVMMWQMWTAFGIMLGYSASLAFLKVSGVNGLNWRLMLGSAGIPALFVMAQVYMSPESPRWLISKGRYKDAFAALRSLRKSDIQAARDLYLTSVMLDAEAEIMKDTTPIVELFKVPRNRRAVLASGIVMFFQQACGVNAIVYYSTNLFVGAGFSRQSAFLSSWGFGALNWLFALPAARLIDTFGRRGLLLTTFPMMAASLLLSGLGFCIENMSARVACVSLGIYLFAIAYSPGEGPVPFTYAAEAFPLYVRDLGMSLSTGITWLFNWAVSFTFPSAVAFFSPQGAFAFYAAWNVVGFFAVLFYVPETRALTLEELDQVFSVPSRKHAAYQFRSIPWWVRTRILRQKDVRREELYEFDKGDFEMYRGEGYWSPVKPPSRDVEKRGAW